jgi:SAM-dependent MidA family methyltransferase
MIASTTCLRQIIAEAGGVISFERFMQEALYHPACGYYAARVGKVGREGDFSTSATLHPALGRAIAAWAAAHGAEVRTHGHWHVIELGGGSGALAASVLHSLGWLRRRRLTYHIVEISPRLQAAQRQHLGALGRRVVWHEAIGPALQQAQGHALIFSNEFVDAFPCVQLVLDPASGHWREVCVHWPDGSDLPQETFGPWPRAADPPSAPTSALAAKYRPGQRVELHLSFRRWLESWRSLLQSGRMLTIDYGDAAAALYERRLGGTLRAYCRQQRFTGSEVYERFGRQDLTADVNFTDLQRWGEDLGLPTCGLRTQRAFFEQWLPRRLLRSASTDAHLAFLLQADGAGTAFKVLEQVALKTRRKDHPTAVASPATSRSTPRPSADPRNAKSRSAAPCPPAGFSANTGT